MAASTAALKAAYLTEVNKISGTLLKARATYQLNRWIDAIEQQAALESNEIQSYSIAGRTVNRRNMKDGQSACDAIEADLVAMIYGNTTLADMNSEVAEPYGRELN